MPWRDPGAPRDFLGEQQPGLGDPGHVPLYQSVKSEDHPPARGPQRQYRYGNGLAQAQQTRRSLTVNAMALMAATLAASALGFAFWGEAAHLEPTYAVGRASAGLAALTLLSMIAQLNLTNIFIRLLPVAGWLSGLLVRRGYLVVAVLSSVVGVVYVSTGLSSHVLTGGLVPRALFALAVPVLSIFALEDSVLVGLRLAPWVAAENVSAAVVRLVLLPVMAALSLSSGVLASWVLPAAAAVIVVNLLLFRRAFPALTRVRGTLPSRRRMVSLVGGEYAGNICAAASVQVVPILVAWRLGATQAAYLTLPWMVTTGIALVMWNVGSSFVVEASRAPQQMRSLLRRSLAMWGGIGAIAALSCVLGGRFLLQLAGSGYASHGSQLLELIGLGAPFYAVVVFPCALAWLDQRVWLLAGFQIFMGITQLSLIIVLLPRFGLAAVGWAYLGTNVTAAIVAAPYTLKLLRRYKLLGVR